MKQDILLVGEGSLLKFKLSSILSRSRRVSLCYTVEEAEAFLRETAVDCTIFCDHACTEFVRRPWPARGGRLICLTSRYAAGTIPPAPSAPGHLQIVYDQLYGFSGYSASGGSAIPILYTAQKVVCPTLADDIAFWLSRNVDCRGLYYLRGPETVTGAGFLQAITMETPAYETVEEREESWPGTVVRLRHTLAQGIDVVRHQRSCAVNLIYKLPLHTPVAGTTVEAIRYRLGAMAAERLPDDVRGRLDYVCPIPHSGIPYGQGAAETLRLPLVSAVAKRTAARSFYIEDPVVRSRMIAGSMEIDGEKARGAKICLVDEAIFSGATLRILSRMLRDCGAAELHVLIPTPSCTAQCPYCSIPTRPMLLETIPAAELPSALGVDSVTFQAKDALETLLQATDMQCCECFS